MLQIKKMRADHVIDFAAEELKKYLRMMMPRCGEIDILYQPDAVDGFRLGLLSDFGLASEAQDPVLDDVIHIDTQAEGGILAGSNPRSVLFAVYRLLRENGCRWLYPGVDGEHVPVRNLQPTRYHKLADHRFRGHCNEGAESQQCMLETIDFYAKQELNVYMIEFDVPFTYYNDYYSHVWNERNRPAEPVSPEQVLQWKRQCEAEISKRGLQFHDMGHGWTAEPFGLDSSAGWKRREVDMTDWQRSCLAQMNGKRDLFRGVALNTNVCMSNPEVRTTMVKSIADYAQSSRNVDYLHVWLADGSRNHCECEECVKSRPSDFYLMIMNELDEELTARGLDTRIVFIAYVDTLFAPEKVAIRNPRRFSLLYAPITRSYSSSVSEQTQLPEPIPYVRNAWQTPKSAQENLALLRTWQKNWKGPSFSYEYHFWRTQYWDPGMMTIARRIYEDIRSLKYMGLDGYVEDGSQRSFFPNGLAIYVYAETLMNRECDFDAVVEDYFSHIYGEAWPEVREYLQQVSDAFDFSYMAGEKSADPTRSAHYDPDRVSRLNTIRALAARGREIARTYLGMSDKPQNDCVREMVNHADYVTSKTLPTRPQSVSMRLLLRHAEYIEGVAAVMAEKAAGNDRAAWETATDFIDRFGRYEFELERYFDHYLGMRILARAVEPPKVILQQGL